MFRPADTQIDRHKLAVAMRAARGKQSLADVATITGLDKATLSRLENEAARLSADTLVRLCAWMGLSMDYFVRTELTTESERAEGREAA